MLLFEGAAVGLGLAFIFSDRLDRMRAQPGVLLGASAGLGFGVSDVAIKAVSGDVLGGSPWIALALCAAIFSFFASARSLQVGEGVAVIAVTSVAANMSSILAGVLVFGDPMGRDAARGRRAHRRVRPGARRRRPDARAGTRGTLGQGPDSGLSSGIWPRPPRDG